MLGWNRLPWRKNNFDDLDHLESSLESIFQPVEPSPEFVRDLRRRLVNFPVPVTPDPDSKIPTYIAMTIASLLSGVAVVGIGIWIILALLGKYQSRDKAVQASADLAL
jgi:hypothetical protein